MLFRVTVIEHVTHQVMVEADSEDEAWEKWHERLGDSDFDEVTHDTTEPFEVIDVDEEEWWDNDGSNSQVVK